MCKAVRKSPQFFGIWTIVDACIFFAVSRSFVNNVILPTLALFFGTGNQVAKLPAPLGAQVFSLGDEKEDDRALTVFDLDMQHFIMTSRNNMLALPPLVAVYNGIGDALHRAGVTVRLQRKADAVIEDGDHVRVMTGQVESVFDKVVMAVQVPDAIPLLPPKHKAFKVLSKTRYYHDISVTHRDTRHMETHFAYKPDLRINYFIHERSPSSMDMGFALHRYQHVSAPLYQTLWLQGKDGTPDRAAALTPQLVLREDHWYQVGHTVSHFVNCVSRLKTVQGPVIYFAGSWTLVNSHEVAVMSGIRAAQHVLNMYSAFPAHTFGPVSSAFKAYAKILDGKPT